MCPLEFFGCLKTSFLIYIIRQSFVTLNLKGKNTLLDNTSWFLWNKTWNDGKCIFHKGERKKRKKHFAKKSFSLFVGAAWRPLNTLRLFFIIFCSSLWKIHLPSFQDLSHKNLLVLYSNVFSHYNIFKIKCNKRLFLDVYNKKNVFLTYKKFQRP